MTTLKDIEEIKQKELGKYWSLIETTLMIMLIASFLALVCVLLYGAHLLLSWVYAC